MTPSSRIQSSIELIGDILHSWQSAKRIPADKIIDRFFKARRYIGSHDRAYIGELVYWCLRNLSLLRWRIAAEKRDGENCSKLADIAAGMSGNSARMIVFSALQLRNEYSFHELEKMCDGGKYSPHSITISEKATLLRESAEIPPDEVRLNYPKWLEAELKNSLGNEFEAAMLALGKQAHSDLRTNSLKTSREALVAALNEEGFDCCATSISPLGVRLKQRAPVFTSPLFKAGHFEMQDEGSQIVAALVDAKPGMKIIDFCAGAGGKTLAIAAQMKNKGRILAWDNSEKRLGQMKERLKRAGVDNVQLHVLESEHDPFIKRHKQSANRVLVDAPCSGTGTWRRNPDLKWRFNEHDLAEMMQLQESILQSSSRLVAVGGRLVYATCSVLSCENSAQIDKFLKNNKNFIVVCAEKIWNNICAEKNVDSKNENSSASVSADKEEFAGTSVQYFSVSPHQDGMDGFFAAILERIS